MRSIKLFFIILLLILAVIFTTAITNTVLKYKQIKYIKNEIKKVIYENKNKPFISDKTNHSTFKSNKDFNIIQLTDIHIGGGWMSYFKDKKAIRAVASIITHERPDLVVITGDISYPVPFQSGTFNNKTSATLFIQLMEKLGVYYANVFGNHDTELYAYYSRKSIGKLYENAPYCLFNCGDENIDGVGNYTIDIENSNGIIYETLFLMDTGSYVDKDYLGAMWKYDGLHENQILWYKKTLENISNVNNKMPKSLLFIHIPLNEYRDAFNEYKSNGYKNTENSINLYGSVGEKNEKMYPSLYRDKMFETMIELNSTKGVFCGHDHLNNFSMNYKGIRLTYGLSIDYLAYKGIKNYGSQRGATKIIVHTDSTFDCFTENYYQEKYADSKKEQVTMNPY